MKKIFSDHEPVISSILAFLFSGLVWVFTPDQLTSSLFVLVSAAIALIMFYFFLRERYIIKKHIPNTKFIATIRDCSTPNELLFTVNINSILFKGSLFLLSEITNEKETIIAIGIVDTINSKGLYQARYQYLGEYIPELKKELLIITPSISSDALDKLSQLTI